MFSNLRRQMDFEPSLHLPKQKKYAHVHGIIKTDETDIAPKQTRMKMTI